LKDAYLVTRAKRRMQALEDREPMILEGIPIMSLNTERRLDVEGPSAPPTEISHEALELEPNKEENIPLTQPSAKDDVDPPPSPRDGP
jgi:hypothetical protein